MVMGELDHDGERPVNPDSNRRPDPATRTNVVVNRYIRAFLAWSPRSSLEVVALKAALNRRLFAPGQFEIITIFLVHASEPADEALPRHQADRRSRLDLGD